MTCDWHPDLFTDFKADACIVIKDADLFARRIEVAASSQLPGWRFYHNPVEYFDPYQILINEHFDAWTFKDFKFAYQREYRFIWVPQHDAVPDGFKFLRLGNLSDLAEVHAKY
jgi:hypothetical protein